MDQREEKKNFYSNNGVNPKLFQPHPHPHTPSHTHTHSILSA